MNIKRDYLGGQEPAGGRRGKREGEEKIRGWGDGGRPKYITCNYEKIVKIGMKIKIVRRIVRGKRK
jgi:hypothetical protein